MTFHVHYDGRFVACMTTNGLDHIRVPSGSFGKPRDAIRYCDMREQRVSPLRAAGETAPVLPPVSAVSPAVLSGGGQ